MGLCVGCMMVPEEHCIIGEDTVRVLDVGKTSRPTWLRVAFGWVRTEPTMRNNIMVELSNEIENRRTRVNRSFPL